MNIKEKANSLKKDISAAYIALKNKNTPVVAKIFAALAVAYALSPIDLIPDVVPVLGYLDDLIILPLLIGLTIEFIPKDIWEESKKEAEGLWKDGKPKKWYYALPVVFIWAIIIAIVVKIIFF